MWVRCRELYTTSVGRHGLPFPFPVSGVEVIYEIRVKGHARRMITAAFEEFDVSIEPGVTVLRADIVDESALQGVLARIHGFGLELIGLHRADEGELE
jgi:hypothetical protein